jgi:SPP1 family predicted phage head-tail adaptor
MMSAGDYRLTLKFLGVETTPDSFGQPIETEKVLRTVRAKRGMLRASDFARGQLTSEVAEAKFITRYVEGVTSGMKVKVNNVSYYIVAVEELGQGSRPEALAISCRVAV